jgi:hypothetical protein
MALAPFWIIGDAEGATPWILNLDGYPSRSAAERAVSWQRVGQGQFDPPGYWRIIEPAELREIAPRLSRSPYTVEAFAGSLSEVTSAGTVDNRHGCQA